MPLPWHLHLRSETDFPFQGHGEAWTFSGARGGALMFFRNLVDLKSARRCPSLAQRKTGQKLGGFLAGFPGPKLDSFFVLFWRLSALLPQSKSGYTGLKITRWA
jgi:hypothetical protein